VSAEDGGLKVSAKMQNCNSRYIFNTHTHTHTASLRAARLIPFSIQDPKRVVMLRC